MEKEIASWARIKKDQILSKKLHHKTYRDALSALQTELAYSDVGEVIVLTGPSRAGKTSLLKRLAREYLDASGGDPMSENPFVYVLALNRAQEGRFSSKAFYADLLRALEHPAYSTSAENASIRKANLDRVDRRNTPDLMAACEHALRYLRTRFLAIDEAQHIEWHGKSAHVRTAILDSFKSFSASAEVTLVLAGAYPIVRMLRSSNHMVGRSSIVEFTPYGVTEEDAFEFLKVLEWYSQGVRFESGVTSLSDWAEYIYTYSLGVVGAVGRWLRSALARMEKEGDTALAWRHMDIARRNDGDLKAIAAEIELGAELLNKTPEKRPVDWKKVKASEKSKRGRKPFEIRNRVYKKMIDE
ncbi:ATP-binding protein [Wenzhouxiangella sp. EGI_FJ10409]|uniref:ATP-binding protein n=1 Tax=Wenzhouxiangella sp. EGI_FJ10409 TaxID=3243767 RepID=UPI0035D680A7